MLRDYKGQVVTLETNLCMSTIEDNAHKEMSANWQAWKFYVGNLYTKTYTQIHFLQEHYDDLEFVNKEIFNALH